MKYLPLAVLVALVGCRSDDHDANHDREHDHEAATMDVAPAELPAIRYYMIADT